MIPVRRGSSRVPGKALRRIGNTTLLEQAIRLSLTYFSKESVFLNTDWDELEDYASSYGINFYRRKENLCTSSSTNDAFMEDFLRNFDCTRVVQLLPTSPFLTAAEFESFCNRAKVLSDTDASLISVAEHRIGCIREDGSPINFQRYVVNPPSQQMEAIFSYATCLMSWSKKYFLESMDKRGSAYHGDNNNEYFKVSHMSQLDIDTEQDLDTAIKLASVLPYHQIKQ